MSDWVGFGFVERFNVWVNNGRSETVADAFVRERRLLRALPSTAEAVLASAAVPPLFRAVHLAGGVYWNGLFSQNPPVRDLARAKPDEIWVIQINPTARAEEPRSARRDPRPAKRARGQHLARAGAVLHRDGQQAGG